MMTMPTATPTPSDRTLAMTPTGTFDDSSPITASFDRGMKEDVPSLSTTALGHEGKGKRATGHTPGEGRCPAGCGAEEPARGGGTRTREPAPPRPRAPRPRRGPARLPEPLRRPPRPALAEAAQRRVRLPRRPRRRAALAGPVGVADAAPRRTPRRRCGGLPGRHPGGGGPGPPPEGAGSLPPAPCRPPAPPDPPPPLPAGLPRPRRWS